MTLLVEVKNPVLSDASLGALCQNRPSFPQNLKAILSDLDGTLICCDKEHMRRFAKKLVEYFGCSFKDGHTLSTLEEFYCYIADQYIEQNKSVMSREYFRHECYAHLGRLRTDLTDPLPGILRALKNLTKKGLLVALCTAREHDPDLYGQLKEKGISKFLSAIVSRSDPYTSGAVKDHIFGMGSSELWVSPKECLVVGDTKDDMESARRMGMFCVGVLTGLNTAEQLYAAGACVVLDSVENLPKFIEAMQSGVLYEAKKAA